MDRGVAQPLACDAAFPGFAPERIVERHFAAGHEGPAAYVHASQFTQFDPRPLFVSAIAFDGSARGRSDVSRQRSRHESKCDKGLFQHIRKISILTPDRQIGQ